MWTRTVKVRSGLTPLAGLLWAAACCFSCRGPRAVTVSIDTSGGTRAQSIDGFGTCIDERDAFEPYFAELLFDDLRTSILRFDATPHFKSPYSDWNYGSPGALGAPALPGPEGNNVRTYRDAASYTRPWAGHAAQIAVMGPDIDHNVAYFDYDAPATRAAGLLAQQGKRRQGNLGNFTLLASLWSPAPWLKLASGRSVHDMRGQRPKDGTPWPFIWKGSFSGGVLDTSGTPRPEFDDNALGGRGWTSALTQFARGLAAYLRGFTRAYGVRPDVLSIQNEPAFEEYYESCLYRRGSDYLVALAAVRAELDRYDDLRPIRLLGPEDVLGGDTYALWQSGRGSEARARNLQLVGDIAPGRGAGRILDLLGVHGYASDGIGPGTLRPTLWEKWWNGWRSAPKRGMPNAVLGVAVYGKRSWMTETSGEQPQWLAPASGFPDQGAFSIAIKLHHALTAGRQSAWLYWQLTHGDAVDREALTDHTQRSNAPKYVAVKHYFRFIRPGSVRVRADVEGEDALLASAFVHDRTRTLTVVLVNTSERPVTATLRLPSSPERSQLDVYTSSAHTYFERSDARISRGVLRVTTPGYGLVTLHGTAAR